MQLAWLDEMTKQGALSEAQRDFIYSDCDAMVKDAALNPEDVARKIESVMMPLALIMGPALIGEFMAHRSGKKEVAQATKDMIATKEKLLGMAEFAGHQDKVEARFTEVARLAPTVARNEDLMHRILKTKLHSGLTQQDAINLTMIQSNYTPFTAQKELSKHAADELQGEMTADAYLLYKEAGISDFLKGDLFKTMKNTAAMATMSGVIGVGAGAIAVAADARSKQNREKRLIQSFATAMDPNHPGTEVLRANPEQAREAFKALAHFSPNTALEPTAARTFMNKIVAGDPHRMGAVHPSEIVDLTTIEKNLRNPAGGSPFFKALSSSLQMTGIGDVMRNGMTPYFDPLNSQLAAQIAKNRGLEKGKPDYQPFGTAAAEKAERAAERANRGGSHP